jgi:nuclear pore complex protein Nup155
VSSTSQTQKPYEAIIITVRDMANRLNLSEATFSPHMIIPLIERYAIEQQYNIGPKTWVPDLFIEVGFPHETIVAVLQNMWYNNIAPFTEHRKRVLAEHIVYVLESWYGVCKSRNEILFAGEENCEEVVELLTVMEHEGGLDNEGRERVVELRRKILRTLR